MSTLLLDDEDWSVQAEAVNSFSADLFLGFDISDRAQAEASYFSVPGYESDAGRRFAELIIKELPAAPGWGVGTVQGMRFQILRETRPPAVLLRLGPATVLESSQALVIASLHRAIEAWATDPC